MHWCLRKSIRDTIEFCFSETPTTLTHDGHFKPEPFSTRQSPGSRPPAVPGPSFHRPPPPLLFPCAPPPPCLRVPCVEDWQASSLLTLSSCLLPVVSFLFAFSFATNRTGSWCMHSPSVSRKKTSPGTDVSSNSRTSSCSEAWKAFLERKAANEALRDRPKSSTETSKASEKHATKKVEEMMAQLSRSKSAERSRTHDSNNNKSPVLNKEIDSPNMQPHGIRPVRSERDTKKCLFCLLIDYILL